MSPESDALRPDLTQQRFEAQPCAVEIYVKIYVKIYVEIYLEIYVKIYVRMNVKIYMEVKIDLNLYLCKSVEKDLTGERDFQMKSTHQIRSIYQGNQFVR